VKFCLLRLREHSLAVAGSCPVKFKTLKVRRYTELPLQWLLVLLLVLLLLLRNDLPFKEAGVHVQVACTLANFRLCHANSLANLSAIYAILVAIQARNGVDVCPEDFACSCVNHLIVVAREHALITALSRPNIHLVSQRFRAAA